MPYHAALALGDSDDEADLREAVTRLDPLSPPAARTVRRKMRELGLRAIPSGVRATTRSDPHGLTRASARCSTCVRDEPDQRADRRTSGDLGEDRRSSCVGRARQARRLVSRRDASALAGT